MSTEAPKEKKNVKSETKPKTVPQSKPKHRPEPEDIEDDFKEELPKKVKTDSEHIESGGESNQKEDLENDLENELDGESNKDDGESIDSIEQQKMAYKFDKPAVWELLPVKIANVWDHNSDVTIYKWTKVRESEPIIYHRDREKKKFYKCDQADCGKIFPDSASLKKHQMVHGEKLFVCSYEGCGKKFLDKSKLRRHQLVHTGEKPHKCQTCGKLFSLDFNLRTHMRTHTGEKPYLCRFPGCNKRFTQSSNLSAHEKIHLQKELGPKGAGEGEVEEVTPA